MSVSGPPLAVGVTFCFAGLVLFVSNAWGTPMFYVGFHMGVSAVPFLLMALRPTDARLIVLLSFFWNVGLMLFVVVLSGLLFEVSRTAIRAPSCTARMTIYVDIVTYLTLIVSTLFTMTYVLGGALHRVLASGLPKKDVLASLGADDLLDGAIPDSPDPRARVVAALARALCVRPPGPTPRQLLDGLWEAVGTLNFLCGVLFSYYFMAYALLTPLYYRSPNFIADMSTAVDFFMVAMLCRRGVREYVHAWLAKHGTGVEAAAGIASLIAGYDPADAIETGRARMLAVPGQLLDSSMFNLTSDSSYWHSIAQPAQLGEVDAFISHSWHDPVADKWEALQRWRRTFVAEHRREPLVWFDRACLDQLRPEQDLPLLPVFLAGCNRLVIIAGETYSTRLWCIMELFVFDYMHAATQSSSSRRSGGFALQARAIADHGGLSDINTTGPHGPLDRPEVSVTSLERVDMYVLPGVNTDSFADFNVASARCAVQEDADRLRASIEAAHGSIETFNARARALLVHTHVHTAERDRHTLGLPPQPGVAVAHEQRSGGSERASSIPGSAQERPVRSSGTWSIGRGSGSSKSRFPRLRAHGTIGDTPASLDPPAKSMLSCCSGSSDDKWAVDSPRAASSDGHRCETRLRRIAPYATAALAFIAVILLAAWAAMPAEADCAACELTLSSLPRTPDGWLTWRGHDYRFSGSWQDPSVVEDFAGAVGACAEMGAELVRIDDAIEDRLVRCLVGDSGRPVWIGYAQPADTLAGDAASGWRWLTGADGDAPYEGWAPGQPDHGRSSLVGSLGLLDLPATRCAAVGIMGWHDEPCMSDFLYANHYVCKRSSQ